MQIIEFEQKAGKNYLQKSILNNISKNLSSEATINRLEGILEALIYDAQLKINHLDIQLAGKTIKLYGEAKSSEDREFAVLIMGNIQEIGFVEDFLTVLNPTKASSFYQIQNVDSLSSLSKKHYNDPLKYHILFEANKCILKDPNILNPGQMIRIPDISNLV